MSAPSSRGRFLVLDGVDGCGKSTQAALLVERLARARAVAPLHLREPGSTPAGERIRAILLAHELELGPAAEALLVCAARAQMLEAAVEPALAAGRDVVCERFHPSTFAYQAIAGGLDEERVLELLSTWAGSPAPDLIVILDARPELAAARRGAPTDRIEAKGIAFQRLVAEGMRRYVARDPRAVIVDANGPVEVVERAIAEEVRRVVGRERV